MKILGSVTLSRNSVIIGRYIIESIRVLSILGLIIDRKGSLNGLMMICTLLEPISIDRDRRPVVEDVPNGIKLRFQFTKVLNASVSAIDPSLETQISYSIVY